MLRREVVLVLSGGHVLMVVVVVVVLRHRWTLRLWLTGWRTSFGRGPRTVVAVVVVVMRVVLVVGRVGINTCG